MALTFDRGNPDQPRGHGLLYFRDRDSQQTVATYVLVLPIQMDMGKYLPPLLASQLGGIAGEALSEGMGSFAAPPMPEEVEGVAMLERLADARGDDLLSGGDISAADPALAIQATAEAVQEYARLYKTYLGGLPAIAVAPASAEAESSDVQRVVFELMSERDRLGEVSKLVGTLRFAAERGDTTLAEETEASMRVLGSLLTERYWVERVLTAARDTSAAGAALARLLMERCYKLLDEDFQAVSALEQQIRDADNRGR